MTHFYVGDLLIEAPLVMWILTEEQYSLKPMDMNEVVEDLVDRSEAKIRKQFNRLAVDSTLKFPSAIYRFTRKNKEKHSHVS